MNVVFLDIDGVLNANEDFGGRGKPNPIICGFMGITGIRVKRLKKIINTTDAKIVLVSSWKRSYEKYLQDRCNQIGKYLRNKLRKENLDILDTTLRFEKTLGCMRGNEIYSWLAQHPDVKNWIILDDEIFDDYDETIMRHLVKTNYLTGLTDEKVEEAIKKLGELK